MPHSSLVPLALAVVLSTTGRGADAQTFGPQVVVDSGAAGADCLLAGDIDGDGLMDLIGTEFTAKRLVWYRQTAPGVYSSPIVIDAALNNAWQCRVGDLDGDLDLDIVATGSASNPAVLYENLGAGASWSRQLLLTGSLSGGALELSDVNGDGSLDILVPEQNEGAVRILHNKGGLQFSERKVNVAGAWGVGTLDYDADGDRDLVVISFSKDALYKAENIGAGEFGPAVKIATLDGPSSVLGRDMDGDGDQDILCTSRNDSIVAWYANDGSGNFGSRVVLTSDLATPYWADAVDANADGIPDLFVAASVSKSFSWFEGLGGGVFGPEQVLDAKSPGARFVSIVDMDGDHGLDVLAASFTDSAFSIFPNLLPLTWPQLHSISALHSIDSGDVVLLGENLSDATLTIDGVPATIKSQQASQLVVELLVDEPGGRHDLFLENPKGTSEWPGALTRYPVFEVPPTAQLGEQVLLFFDNGDVGGYVLAVSGGLFVAPAPFEALGWYYGLELNGVWFLGAGVFTPGETAKSISLPVVSDAGLVGTTFYFQAWTTQATLGYAGFTAAPGVLIQ
jgi:hypothetical protein